MPQLHFTKAAIDALDVPAGKRVRFTDSGPKAVRHLMLAVIGGSGKRVFYHYRRIGKQVVETRLGVYPEMTIEQARNAAETLNVQVGQGINPAATRAEARRELTLAELFTWHGENFTRRKKSELVDLRRLQELLPRAARQAPERHHPPGNPTPARGPRQGPSRPLA